MIPYHLIRRKRDGEALKPAEIDAFFRGYATAGVTAYQMAAFLMAVYYQGLDESELTALVDVMLASGAVVRFDGSGRRVDKHSTGGVGDKVSLVLAPLVSSLGVAVPMMSGRGLGHTGGTLDKLEAIPGFRTDLSLEQFRSQVERLGCALIGQTGEIAPLDRELYALRDVTATVESVPLIASSIMSKKIAEGIDALVLDVKRGGGAFLPELERALELARTMIAIGERHGVEVVALVSAMDRPLGRAVGNAVETAEAIEVLHGAGPEDLRRLTVELAAEMLVLGEAAADRATGRRNAEAALDDGRALRQMQRIVEAQHGDPATLEDPAWLPRAPIREPVSAERSGMVSAVDARAIGEAAVRLGAGRATRESRIDPSVGFVLSVRPGDRVEAGQPLAEVLAASEADARRAAADLRSAVHVDDEMGEPPLPLVSHRVTAAGVEDVRDAG